MPKISWPLLIVLLSITSEAQRRKVEAAVPIQLTDVDFIAPQVNEIKGYFITICLALFGFFVKEMYSWLKSRNSTLGQDLIELKKNDMIMLNKLELIQHELRHKPDREEVLKEIINYLERNEKR